MGFRAEWRRRRSGLPGPGRPAAPAGAWRAAPGSRARPQRGAAAGAPGGCSCGVAGAAGPLRCLVRSCHRDPRRARGLRRAECGRDKGGGPRRGGGRTGAGRPRRGPGGLSSRPRPSSGQSRPASALTWDPGGRAEDAQHFQGATGHPRRLRGALRSLEERTGSEIAVGSEAAGQTHRLARVSAGPSLDLGDPRTGALSEPWIWSSLDGFPLLPSPLFFFFFFLWPQGEGERERRLTSL